MFCDVSRLWGSSVNKVLESTLFVVEHATHVRIDQKKLEAFCFGFDFGEIQHWLDKAPFDIRRLAWADRIAFLFVLNSVSFCYWSFPKWRVLYRRKELDGTWALVACLGMAAESGIPICDPEYLGSLTMKEFTKITNGNTVIPLVESRVSILNELGQEVMKRHQGSFVHILELAEFRVSRLLDLLPKEIRSFKDSQIYRGRVVHFLKRAQLLASDLYQVLSWDRGEAQCLTEASELTACADYKLPQVLRRLGILQYSTALARRIDKFFGIERGSKEEVEIRACTVWAVEGIRHILSKRRPHLLACEINDFLWLAGQKHHPDNRPYHLTLTTAY